MTLFFICGLTYAAVISFIGRGIPCIFRLITGFRCPGCGITHSLLSLLRLDFYGALHYNYCLPLIILYTAAVFFHTAAHYIKTGKFYLTCGKIWIDNTACVVIILWGIVRNIIGI